MLKRILGSAVLVTAVCAITLVPAAETVASGGVSAGFICEPALGGWFCEVPPGNPTYSYSWSSSAGVSVATSGGAFARVSCLDWPGGTVSVTVTTPSGDTDTASGWFNCGQGSGGGGAF